MNRQARCIACLVAVTMLTAPIAGFAHETDHNKGIVKRMVELINDRDFTALRDLLAPDLKRHSGATPWVTIENREQFIDFLHQDLAGVPDAHMEVDFLLAEDDLVAMRIIYSGTQTGPWGPFPPSGRHVEMPFIGIQRIEDGRIAEIWVEWDNLNVMQQLGHFPPPPPEGTEATDTD